MEIDFKKASVIFLGCLFSVFFTTTVSGQNMFRKINDFDGDGKADFAVTRNIDGNKYWYIWQSTAGFRVMQWGFNTDENAVGDYDGDGKTDIGIFRKQMTSPTQMIYSFWVIRSQQGVMTVGAPITNVYPDSVAHQQDYDGNGRTDAALTIRDNTEYLVLFDGGGTISYTNPGGKLVKLGDMIGNNRADTASFNTNNNQVSLQEPGFGNPIQRITFGLSGDEFVAADFDGDGKGDLTVFRPSDGTWWWLRSSDGVINAASFGTTGDVPVPADYDGDGKTDLAIWRGGSQSRYWVYGSQVGIFVFDWGLASDVVVRY